MNPVSPRSVVNFHTFGPVDSLGTNLWTPLAGVDQPRNVRGCDLRWSTGPRGCPKKVDHPGQNAVTCGTPSPIYIETHGGPEVVHALGRFAAPRLTQALKNQPQSGPVQVVPSRGWDLSGPPHPLRPAVGRTSDTADRHHEEHTS